MVLHTRSHQCLQVLRIPFSDGTDVQSIVSLGHPPVQTSGRAKLPPPYPPRTGVSSRKLKDLWQLTRTQRDQLHPVVPIRRARGCILHGQGEVQRGMAETGEAGPQPHAGQDLVSTASSDVAGPVHISIECTDEVHATDMLKSIAVAVELGVRRVFTSPLLRSALVLSFPRSQHELISFIFDSSLPSHAYVVSSAPLCQLQSCLDHLGFEPI